jgi:hypothetical protein
MRSRQISLLLVLVLVLLLLLVLLPRLGNLMQKACMPCTHRSKKH